jgi:hypothetical protein
VFEIGFGGELLIWGFFIAQFVDLEYSKFADVLLVCAVSAVYVFS